MKTWGALLISSVVIASTCCLLVFSRRPAPQPAAMGETALVDAVRSLETRLERIEEAIGRLSSRAGGSTVEPQAPVRPESLDSASSNGKALAAMLRSIEGQIEELRKGLAARGDHQAMATLVFEPPEEAPPELQVRLETRLVQDGDALGVKVYWRILSGASSATEQDWVGLFLVDATDNQYVRWQYTKGLPAGEASFKLPETAGLYEVRYFFKSGYARVPGASGPVNVPRVEPPAEEAGGQAKEKP